MRHAPAFLSALLLAAACDGGGAPPNDDPSPDAQDAAEEQDADAASDVEGDPQDAGSDVDGDPQDADAPPCEPLECPGWARACEGAACPTLSEYAQVVPGLGMPAELTTQKANNNLDVVRHEGRVFLAFRTAPTHFAGRATQLHVVSSEDQLEWRFEASFSMGTDLREPRLLSWEGRLFLYFAVLGDNPLDFEPQGARASEYLGPARWSEPEEVLAPGVIPWRTKVVQGAPMMTAYEGGENIYDIDGEPIRVSWLTTQDGLAWTPVVPEVPFVLEGGASETDFELLDDGSLVAVSRNEAGDALGWGSKVCTAPSDDLGAWSCASDPRKYDSPLLFQHEGQVWLIARRHLTDTGHYDLGSDEPDLAKRTRDYLIAYSTTPKRCALWKVDPAQKKVEFVLDLPSRGDTCFASALPEPDGSYWIYNYTSDPSGPELTWAEGQVRPTLIYRVRLRLP